MAKYSLEFKMKLLDEYNKGEASCTSTEKSTIFIILYYKSG